MGSPDPAARRRPSRGAPDGTLAGRYASNERDSSAAALYYDRALKFDPDNPEILERRGDSEVEEGCLSVPGIFDKIPRAKWIRVAALDREGRRFELEADGLLSVCIQHEMDHLAGHVFVEYLSTLKQTRIRGKMKKLEKAL